MMATRFDAAQLDARDRTWYYGLTFSYRLVVDWLMDNLVDTYDGVSLSAIARGTGLNMGTVRLAVASLEQFGYITIAWRNGQIWQVYPMHGFDLSEGGE